MIRSATDDVKISVTHRILIQTRNILVFILHSKLTKKYSLIDGINAI